MKALRFSLLLLALSSVAACGDSTSPSEGVAGTYHATQIDITFPGEQPIDVIAAGGSVDIVLTPQGTTTGTLVVPAEFTEDGIEDDVIDLAGTFTIAGNALTFHGQGDSFIPESEWTIGNDVLTHTRNEPEGTLELTLTRE
jgi:hypothetical protein